LKNLNRRIEVLADIAKDQEDDVTAFDSKPFTGRTVAQGAAIAALANIMISILQDMAEIESVLSQIENGKI
jgi:hypothetical protein